MTLALLIAFMLQQVPAEVPASAPAATAGPEAQLAAIVTRGRLLYQLDQAAWHSTDALRRDVSDPAAAGVRGWIVEPEGDAMRVTYYGFADATPVPIYMASFKRGKVSRARLVPATERRPLGPEAQRMIAARDAMTKQSPARCVPQPFNSIVVPPTSADAPIDVYLLTPQTKANAWPVGKHYRLGVAKSGAVGSPREFTKSCMTLGTEGLPKGARPIALSIGHVLDPVPTELHVFTALASRIPLVVQTGETYWHVDGTKIRRLAASDPLVRMQPK